MVESLANKVAQKTPINMNNDIVLLVVDPNSTAATVHGVIHTDI